MLWATLGTRVRRRAGWPPRTREKRRGQGDRGQGARAQGLGQGPCGAARQGERTPRRGRKKDRLTCIVGNRREPAHDLDRGKWRGGFGNGETGGGKCAYVLRDAVKWLHALTCGHSPTRRGEVVATAPVSHVCVKQTTIWQEEADTGVRASRICSGEKCAQSGKQGLHGEARRGRVGRGR
jgi:hypothetical protein